MTGNHFRSALQLESKLREPRRGWERVRLPRHRGVAELGPAFGLERGEPAIEEFDGQI